MVNILQFHHQKGKKLPHNFEKKLMRQPDIYNYYDSAAYTALHE
jgi:hypothetical protein